MCRGSKKGDGENPLLLITLIPFIISLYVEKIDIFIMLQLKIALGSAIYASLLYLIVSVIWCLFFPTNAYRFIKKI